MLATDGESGLDLSSGGHQQQHQLQQQQDNSNDERVTKCGLEEEAEAPSLRARATSASSPAAAAASQQQQQQKQQQQGRRDFGAAASPPPTTMGAADHSGWSIENGAREEPEKLQEELETASRVGVVKLGGSSLTPPAPLVVLRAGGGAVGSRAPQGGGEEEVKEDEEEEEATSARRQLDDRAAPIVRDDAAHALTSLFAHVDLVEREASRLIEQQQQQHQMTTTETEEVTEEPEVARKISLASLRVTTTTNMTSSSSGESSPRQLMSPHQQPPTVDMVVDEDTDGLWMRGVAQEEGGPLALLARLAKKRSELRGLDRQLMGLMMEQLERLHHQHQDELELRARLARWPAGLLSELPNLSTNSSSELPHSTSIMNSSQRVANGCQEAVMDLSQMSSKTRTPEGDMPPRKRSVNLKKSRLLAAHFGDLQEAASAQQQQVHLEPRSAPITTTTTTTTASGFQFDLTSAQAAQAAAAHNEMSLMEAIHRGRASTYSDPATTVRLQHKKFRLMAAAQPADYLYQFYQPYNNDGNQDAFAKTTTAHNTDAHHNNNNNNLSINHHQAMTSYHQHLPAGHQLSPQSTGSLNHQLTPPIFNGAAYGDATARVGSLPLLTSATTYNNNDQSNNSNNNNSHNSNNIGQMKYYHQQQQHFGGGGADGSHHHNGDSSAASLLSSLKEVEINNYHQQQLAADAYNTNQQPAQQKQEDQQQQQQLIRPPQPFEMSAAAEAYARALQQHHRIAFRCHVCGSGFEDRHRLQQHLSIHLNLQSSWFEEKTIKETMAQYESKRGDYLCSGCNLRYETTADFDRHMQLHGDKPHRCELCGQDNKLVCFRYYRQLLTHLRSHCFLYSCRFSPDCKQTANRKDYLKLHILKHHLNNKLPEQYTICCH